MIDQDNRIQRLNSEIEYLRPFKNKSPELEKLIDEFQHD